MEHLKSFENHANFENGGGTLVRPGVAYCKDEKHVHYKSIPNANGHEYVDLGLPSGTLGATCNINTSQPYYYGSYFKGGSSTRDFNTQPTSSYSKYNARDGLRMLLEEDDPVRYAWGGSGRLPTKEECQELLDNCVIKGTSLLNPSTNNDIYGCSFSSKTNSVNSIFIPAAGYLAQGYYPSDVGGKGEYCMLGTSDLYLDNDPATPQYAGLLSLSKTKQYVTNNVRYYAQSVRGVIGL